MQGRATPESVTVCFPIPIYRSESLPASSQSPHLHTSPSISSPQSAPCRPSAGSVETNALYSFQKQTLISFNALSLGRFLALGATDESLSPVSLANRHGHGLALLLLSRTRLDSCPARLLISWDDKRSLTAISASVVDGFRLQHST